MSLHVAVSGWLLGPWSGANRRLLALVAHAAALLGEDERITVLHPEAWQPPWTHDRVHFRPIAIPAGGPLRRAIAERRQLPRVLAAIGANVLDHGFLPTPRVPGAVVQTIHDLRQLDGFGRWPRWLARRVLTRGCARATAIVVPSAFTQARLRAHVPDASCTVVQNGVTLPDDVAATPTAAATGPLLHVGHLEPRKNLDVVVRALARLPATARPPLWLAGADAGERAPLLALARSLGIQDAVRCLGPVDDADLGGLYRGARAVVLPARYEGFGLCALEALAYGRPVLAADAAALPEVLGDQGVLLPPDDAAAWAHAIAATATDRGLAAARRAQAAMFSWPRAAQAILAVWRAAAGRPAPLRTAR